MIDRELAATKAKMSEIHKARKRKPLSKETKAKISATLKARNQRGNIDNES